MYPFSSSLSLIWAVRPLAANPVCSSAHPPLTFSRAWQSRSLPYFTSILTFPLARLPFPMTWQGKPDAHHVSLCLLFSGCAHSVLYHMAVRYCYVPINLSQTSSPLPSFGNPHGEREARHFSSSLLVPARNPFSLWQARYLHAPSLVRRVLLSPIICPDMSRAEQPCARTKISSVRLRCRLSSTWQARCFPCNLSY